MRLINRERVFDRYPADGIMVRTWCRVCGQAALVKIDRDYDAAIADVHWIDDQQMNHEGHHENGGWGVHWRLDDVLRSAFPGQHQDDLFPMPAWYPHRTDREIIPPILRILKKNGVDRIL